MSLYWEAVRLTVCRSCVEGDGSGNCHLPHGDVCALVAFFPKIVQAVRSVQAAQRVDQVRAVQNAVCAQCSHQLPNGFCAKRNNQSCALNRFFPLVIETIETVQQAFIRTQ